MRLSSLFLLCALYCSLLLLSLGSAFAQDTKFATGPQYLLTHDSTSPASAFFTRPISTPTLALPNPLLEPGASNATEGLDAGADTETGVPHVAPPADLLPIYYGVPRVSVVEISFSPEPSADALPASILDAGVWQITTSQALHQRGYEVTLIEAAADGKARARHSNRVYTNADIDRLHSGS
jgi:hypothetical protein